MRLKFHCQHRLKFRNHQEPSYSKKIIDWKHFISNGRVETWLRSILISDVFMICRLIARVFRVSEAGFESFAGRDQGLRTTSMDNSMACLQCNDWWSGSMVQQTMVWIWFLGQNTCGVDRLIKWNESCPAWVSDQLEERCARGMGSNALLFRIMANRSSWQPYPPWTWSHPASGWCSGSC